MSESLLLGASFEGQKAISYSGTTVSKMSTNILGDIAQVQLNFLSFI